MVLRDGCCLDYAYNPQKRGHTLPKKENNKKLQDSAEVNAWWMRKNPSFLERMMLQFLDNNNIQYEFQKIFYIAGKNNYITRYFIADFYIPSKKVVIEMDGKFHKEQEKQDKRRTALIKDYYKKVKVIRMTYKDMNNPNKLRDLLTRIK